MAINMEYSIFTLYSIFLVITCAILNNARGGTIIPLLKFMDNLPKSTYWLWVFVFPLMYVYGFDWMVSLALALGSLVWALPPWSRWTSLNHLTPAYGEGRPVSWFEKIIDTISFNNSYLGLFVRHIICLIPVTIACYFLLGPAALILFVVALGAVIGYTIGWHLMDNQKIAQPFPVGEFITGAVGGLAIVAIHYLTIGFHTLFS